MRSDLFRIVFKEMSQFDWAAYQTQFLDELHLNLLRSAARRDREIGDSPDFAVIYDALAKDAQRQWKNPELYPPIYEALLHGKAQDAGTLLDKLALQVDDQAIHEKGRGEGLVRRTFLEPHLASLSGGSAIDRDRDVIADIHEGAFPLVYMPVDGLFEDIVGEDVYWGASAEFDRDEARTILSEAASSLRRYSNELYDGFCDSIGVLALTGEPVEDVPRSFSARTLYAGGIFSAIKRNNVPAMVENLIHEYYHQRLWLWWMIEGPADLPPPDVTMTSPVTGAEKSVQVMLHALLIYVSVSHYYRFALTNDNMSDAASYWAARRLEKLQSGSVKLRDRLMTGLEESPETRRYVDCIGDYVIENSFSF